MRRSGRGARYCMQLSFHNVIECLCVDVKDATAIAATDVLRIWSPVAVLELLCSRVSVVSNASHSDHATCAGASDRP